MTSEMNSGSGAAPSFFARKATGLTREVSWVDALFYNLLWSSIPLSLAFLLAFGPSEFTSASPYWTVIATLALAMPCALLYAMFSAAVPRSGGDYTWITRTMSPVLGFMSNVSFIFWVTFFIGVYAVYLGAYGLSPAFRVLASYMQSPSMLSTSNWFAGETGSIVVGLVVVALSAGVLILGRGLRTFMKLQKWAFGFWFLGAVVIPFIIVALISKGTFIAHFNSYVSGLGGSSDAYAALLKSSPPLGASAHSLGGSLLMMVLPFYTIGFIFQSTYFGGEIKRARNSAMKSIVWAEAIAGVVLLIGIAIFGMRLSAFMGITGFGDFSKIGMPAAPLYTEVASIASGNIVLGLIISIGMVLVFITWIPQTMLLVSRSLFAWSFDGLLPAKVSDVNPKTHSPVFAVAIISVLSAVSVVIVGMHPNLTFVVGLLGLTVTYLLVSVAGIIFPFRQKDVFEASPFNGRIGGFPTMSLVAILSFIGIGIITTTLLMAQYSGTSWQYNRSRVILCIAIVVLAAPLYYIIRAIRKSQGVNIDLAYQEIPPE
ncbi:MAG: APC family permease [Actinomycetota bacterium]